MDISSLIHSNASITIPRGRKDLAPLSLDIKDITTALSRVNELERINQYTYPEFVTVLNSALIQSGRLLAIIEIEHREAKNTLDVVQSIVRLERVESVLSAKNIKSSADTREAAVIIDPEVQEAIQRRDLLYAWLEWAKHVHASLERMYYTAKQIIEMPQYTSLNTGNFSLNDVQKK